MCANIMSLQLVSSNAVQPPPITEGEPDRAPVVIVGAGPAGVRTLRELRRHAAELPVQIYGDERHQPYNRVQLSNLLAGNVGVPDIGIGAELLRGRDPNTRFISERIEAIDPERKTVTDSRGRVQAYSSLVLALGSAPFVPEIPGVRQPGVFTFRDLADAEKLAARRVQSKHTVVLGAGLLGVEVARAMQRHHTRVTLIDHNPHPLFRQLDPAAGALLAEELEARGIELRLGSGIRMVLGTAGVEGVILRDGSSIPCDTLIVATGIRPRTRLAKSAGVAFGRGITVDSTMLTSAPDIYAVGECCELDGQVFGIVAPGYEQAAIAARNIVTRENAPAGNVPTAGNATTFHSASPATSLKVAGVSVFSMGDPDPPTSTRSYTWRDGSSYRRINVFAGRVVGVIAIGDWPQLSLLRDLCVSRKRIYPWQLLRFRLRGNVLADSALLETVADWPETAVVCNCNAVTSGELRAAAATGATTVPALCARTQAGTGCGSCQPLLSEFLGVSGPRQPAPTARALSALGWPALTAVLLGLVFSVAYPATVQLEWRWDELWRDNLYKQVSGYLILGMSAVSVLFSLRKRLSWVRLGNFAHWRLVHVVLTALAMIALAAHTGFRLGANLNLMLMLTFLGLLAAGAIMSLVIALEHRLPAGRARRLRNWGLWSHVLLAWPIPALLSIHILKSYYF